MGRKKRVAKGLALILLIVSFLVFYQFCRDDLVTVAANAMSGNALQLERPHVQWDSRGYRCQDFQFFFQHENKKGGKVVPAQFLNYKSEEVGTDGPCLTYVPRMYSDWDIHIYTPTWDNVVVVRPAYGEQE